MSKRDQVQYYDDRWSDFARANNWELRRCLFILDSIRRTGFRNPRMLDLGAGAGWLTNIISMFGPAHGLDLSPEAVRLAAANFRYATFEAVDLFTWTIPKNQFDIVVSQEVIEHTDDQHSYLQIAHGALKPGGYLILTTPNATVFQTMSDNVKANWPPQPIENHLTSSQLRQLLVTEKFQIIRTTTVLPIYQERGAYRLFNGERSRRIFAALGLEEAWLAFREHVGLGLHLAVVAQKPLQ